MIQITVMIDGKHVFDRPMKNYLIIYESIQKITTGHGGDYTTGRLLDYNYFKNHYNMIAIDLSKQQVLGSDPKAIKQINFTANLDRVGNATIFFVIEEVKETALDFSQGTVRVL